MGAPERDRSCSAFDRLRPEDNRDAHRQPPSMRATTRYVVAKHSPTLSISSSPRSRETTPTVENTSLEPTMGIEPTTSSLPRKCSTTELGGRSSRAGDGIRTRDIQLGRLTLYQLSYSRVLVFSDESRGSQARAKIEGSGEWWIRTTVGVEPADLQSAPFGRSGNSPMIFVFERDRANSVRVCLELATGLEPTTTSLQNWRSTD
jgi:hypothetical protein